MAAFTLVTWNINSVRLRLPQVERMIDEVAPDVICLQETKCQDDKFPLKDFAAKGYVHTAIYGQKGYHGVAVLAKRPFEAIERKAFCGKTDGRHLAVSFGPEAGFAEPVRIHNFYVPAGGDEPDPDVNDKFAHKLAFLDEMTAWDDLRVAAAGTRAVLVGDLNIAPLEHDVWSSRQLRNVVSHTPLEREKLTALAEAGGWVDVMRRFVPPSEKLYTWWSYRAADWAAADRGRRLDHVWVSPALWPQVTTGRVMRDTRSWQQPSDHVPVIVTLDA